VEHRFLLSADVERDAHSLGPSAENPHEKMKVDTKAGTSGSPASEDINPNGGQLRPRGWRRAHVRSPRHAHPSWRDLRRGEKKLWPAKVGTPGAHSRSPHDHGER
jgi:hypothetical protein